jgi:hypothetical protein
MPSPTIKGTAFARGITGTVTGIRLQSYSISVAPANTEEIPDQDGYVEGVIMYDTRKTFTFEGFVPTPEAVNLSYGTDLSFTGQAGESFSGFLVSYEERGQVKGQTVVSGTATEYEGI